MQIILCSFYAFQHENLLWKIAIPEWALQIAMDRFHLTRDGAINHLKKQDQAEINYLSGIDLMI